MWYWRHRISGEASDILENLGALMSRVNRALRYWISPLEPNKKRKKALANAHMTLKKVFPNSCVIAVAKHKIWKNLGAPTAILVRQHEKFQAGMNKQHCKYRDMNQNKDPSHLEQTQKNAVALQAP